MPRFAGAIAAAALAAACTTAPVAGAQTPPPSDGHMMHMAPMSSIQPETTITLNGHGSVDRAPDIATISVGVSVDAESAAAAMSQQSEKMNGVFKAVKAAGVADKDMQTSNLSLNPVYDYSNRNNGKPRLTGYNASNQLTIVVRNLDSLGKTLDAVVKAGGNTINGVSFGVDKPKSAQDEARVMAIKDAAAKAELYAKAVGYKVKRIVTINESVNYGGPVPVMARMAMDSAESAPTPVAGGQVSLTADVDVTFELTK
ncbi:MAG: SIMPL domain-containing protein [Hyphomonadaceae bacterium]